MLQKNPQLGVHKLAILLVLAMQSTYHTNKWKLFLSNLGNDSTFSLGVFVIFMLFAGLSLAQISLIISAQLIITSLGSLPGGLFADRYGHKKALLYGSIIFLLGTTIFAFGQNFYWFLVGCSLIGLGIAFKTGTQYAVLYEGLRADGYEADYKRVAGKIDLFTNIFWVASSILGGVLYSLNHRLPFYGEIAVALASVIGIYLLVEPKIEKPTISIVKQIQVSLKTSFTKKNFSKIFIFSAFIGSIALLTIQYVQPLYKSVHIPEASFGLIAAVLFVMRGTGSWFSKQLGTFFSVDKYLVMHAATFGLFLILIQRVNTALFILPILAVLYFLRGLYNPTISNYINDRVGSEQRATLLSINNQLLSLTTSFFLIITGFIAGRNGLQAVFFTISIFSMIFLILYVLFLRKIETG